MRSSQGSPLAGLLGASAPRRSRSGVLGKVLAALAILGTALVLIGFGADQQAHHHVVPDTHTSQHS